jgi:hypothetical protein
LGESKVDGAVKGKIWLILGAIAGIAIGVGKLPYLAGAAGSLSDTSLRVVGTAELSIIHSAAHHGASTRVVEGLAAVLGVLIPGLTAVILIYVARGTLRLRWLISLVMVGLGIASFAYLPHGLASGVAVLAFIAAGIAIVATGPLVAAPLSALAGLIGAVFLPKLLATHSTLPNAPVMELHKALFDSVGSPLWLRIVVLAVAAAPFAWAARLVLR